MGSLEIKSKKDIKKMHQGGQKLARIRDELVKSIHEGVSAFEIEKKAVTLIEKTGGKASFKGVPRYSWATCVNINEGVVHGIPKQDVIFKNGDVVSIDLGLFYKGFHTDTSISVLVGNDKEKEEFLKVGRKALESAIGGSKPGNKVGDISCAIETVLKKEGLNPIRKLVGHGIGRRLHEDPFIPCFVSGAKVESVRLQEGMALAIEVMYTNGSGDIVVDKDGWTIRTKDAKIAALFEETIAVTSGSPLVLTVSEVV